MTSAQVSKSIKRHSLELTLSEKLVHYEPCILCLGIFLCLLGLFVFVSEIKDVLIDDFLWLYWFFGGIGSALYFCQRSRLKLRRFKTRLPYKLIIDVIAQLSIQQDWQVVEVGTNFIIVKSGFSFSHNSWGERMTILFDKNLLFVNSINDPNKRASLTKGRNKENIEAIIKEIQRTENLI